MDFWSEKAPTLVDAAKKMLDDAGFGDYGSFLARRVKDGVLNLASQFQQENYSAIVGRLVVALFARVARGSPPTPDFLREVWHEIEAFAKDEPYDEQAEKQRWILKRYPSLCWRADLQRHIGESVFPRPNDKFAGAPLVREDPEKPSDDLVRRIKSLLWDGQRMDAIKSHMDATGVEFDKSRAFVDSLYHTDDGSRVIGPETSIDDIAIPKRELTVSELEALVTAGRKIEAIKLYKAATDKGLKESKDFVDELERRMKPVATIGLLGPVPKPVDSYGFAVPAEPKFSALDNYGSGSALAGKDFISGKASGTLSAVNVEINLAALGAALGFAKETEENMDAKSKTVGIVKEFCRNLESFTSLDVSNRAKADGLVARHREIAELVRATFANGEMDTFGYKRDLIDVTIPGGNTAQTYLYHHTTVPVDDYKDRSQVALKPTRQPVQAQPAPVPYNGDDDDNDAAGDPLPSLPTPIIPATTANHAGAARVLNTSSVTRTQKGDGRLEVPRVWMVQLGWQIGDTVSAVRDGNGLILKTDIGIGDQVVRSFTVDRWNRIRITTKALSEAGIHFGTGGQHIMTLRTGDIRID